MTTTLYNTNTNQLLGKFRQGWYKVDGVRPQLEDHIVELVVTATEPVYNPATHKAVSNWEADLAEMQWKQVWTYTEKSAVELAREQWHHETPLRIHAPKALLADQQLMAIMLLLRDIQRVETETGFYLYVNEIAAEDEATFAYLQSEEIITVEEWPVETI